MTASRRPRFPLSGPQLAAVLAAILLATAVLPPAAAWWLNQSRVAQTQARALDAGERLRSRAADIAAAATAVAVACGPGRLPDIVPTSSTARAAAASLPAHHDWLVGATRVPGLFGDGMPTDAWGRCFLLNVGDWTSTGPIWLLSTGPNGLADTPATALSVRGDDIGDRVR